MANEFMERSIFDDSTKDFIGWGYPTAANFRMGQRFCKHSLYRNVNVLTMRSIANTVWEPNGVEVRPIQGFDAEFDELWGRFRTDVELAYSRTAAYLNWRYVECPSNEYVLLEARDASSTNGSGRLRGLAVARRGGLVEDIWMIVDWVVPREDSKAREALIDACATLALQDGRPTLVAWFPESMPEFAFFQELGFRVEFTSMIHAGRSSDASMRSFEIRQAAYTTFGDMDYL